MESPRGCPACWSTMRAELSSPPSPSFNAPISVALVEDNRLVREGMVSLLNRRPDLRVVASGASLEVVRSLQAPPQVLLLDIGLEHADSVAVAETARTNWPVTRVIVMDLLPVHDDLVAFVNAGVRGFVMKDATLDDLAATIRAVASGESVLPPIMLATLFTEIARETLGRGRADLLDDARMTQRERQVVDLIASGSSNKEIATTLGIAAHTVKSHVRNVMDKLQLHSRLQISAFMHGDGPA
jgi:two-component system, NarL family, nitrate/nitrite response regulator NarL